MVQFIRGTKLEWPRHVWRADGKLIKRTINEEMVGTRPQGRLRRKEMDSVPETVMKLTQPREVD